MVDDPKRMIIVLGGMIALAIIWLALNNPNPQPIRAVETQGILDWDIDHAIQIKDEDRQLFRAAAAKVLNDEPRCRRVVSGNSSSNLSKPSSKPYYIACVDQHRQEFNIPFDKEDPIGDRPLKSLDAYDEQRSRQLCESSIENSVAHRSTLNISTRYDTKVFGSGNRSIQMDFSAKNSFGLELRYVALCTVRPDGKADLAIAEKR